MASTTTLARLLLKYEELRRAGTPPSAEELCRDCPELLDELKRRIADLEGFDHSSDPGHAGEKDTQDTPQVMAGTLQPGAMVEHPTPGKSATGADSSLSETTGPEIRPGSEPVPGYQLVGRLGRGNFGEVWKAMAPGGFPVALKMMPMAEKVRTTELHALEIIKAIRHPNLVTAFGAWQLQGFLIVAMELADRTLWDRYQEARNQGLSGIPPTELLEYFRQAAKGVDYLNEPQHTFSGKQRVSIQHRDIKPQNILLVGSGVKVADFGLVRVLDRAMTGHTGNMTPAYAAPEFLQGQTSNQSDQYCLAVTYCELRGGRLPFEGTLEQVLHGHLANAPDLSMLPESERSAVKRGLAKEPLKRWPSCQAFVEALAASMQPRTVSKRDTRSSWLIAALVALLAGISVTFLPQLLQTLSKPEPPVRNGSAETAANAKSKPTEDEKVTKPVRESPEHQARSSTGPADQNSVEFPHVAASDGSRVATQSDKTISTTAEDLSASKPDRVGELCQFVQHQGEVRAVAVSPNGRYAISADEAGIVWLWEAETGQPIHRFAGHTGAVHCVAFAPDGHVAISGGEDSLVRLWDIEARTALGALTGHTEAVFSVAFSSDGLNAISGGKDTTVRVWNVEDGKERSRLNLPSGESVWSLALSADNRHLLTASDSRAVRLWDIEQSEVAYRFEDHHDVVWCVALSADGRWALSGGGLSAGQQDYALRLWDIEKRKLVRELKGHSGAVGSVAFTQDGRRAVSGATDRTLRLWNLDSGEELYSFQGHESTVHCVTISRDGRRALSASGDGTVRVWKLLP